MKTTILQGILLTATVIYAAMVAPSQEASPVDTVGHKEGSVALVSMVSRSNMADYAVFGQPESQEIAATETVAINESSAASDTQAGQAEEKPTYLIYFTATWCGPCRAQRPIIEEIQAAGVYKVYIVDIDQQPHVADSWGVGTVPTIEIVKNGKRTYKLTGSGHSREELEKLLAE